jgi:hypothetical protein
VAYTYILTIPHRVFHIKKKHSINGLNERIIESCGNKKEAENRKELR